MEKLIRKLKNGKRKMKDKYTKLICIIVTFIGVIITFIICSSGLGLKW